VYGFTETHLLAKEPELVLSRLAHERLFLFQGHLEPILRSMHQSVSASWLEPKSHSKGEPENDSRFFQFQQAWGVSNTCLDS